MSLNISHKRIQVCYKSAFMLSIILTCLGSTAMLLYSTYIQRYTPPLFITLLFSLLFLIFLSSLLAHMQTFLKGEDVLIWQVDQSGFQFQNNRTNLFSLKAPVQYSWSETSSVCYVKKYTTRDSELDIVHYQHVILVFGHLPHNQCRMLSFPGNIGFELFNVLQGLNSGTTVFKKLEKFSDI